MRTALANLGLYLLIRIFMIIFLLSLVTTVKAQGFIWWVILGFVMLISSGWLIYLASKSIIKEYKHAVSLVISACVIDFFVAFFLFGGANSLGSNFLYALTCGASFIVVHHDIFFKEKKEE